MRILGGLKSTEINRGNVNNLIKIIQPHEERWRYIPWIVCCPQKP